MNTGKMHNPLCRQRGISMVELMVATVLGLFLMAGVLQLFTNNKATFNNMEGISEVQDSGRAGIERLKSRVRMAAYMGCSNAGAVTPNNKTTGAAAVAFNPNVVITGQDNVATPGIVAGTDVLTVMFASAANASMTTDMSANNSNIIIASNPSNIGTNDTLIITDCENADIMSVTSFLGAGPYTIVHAQNDQGGNQVNTDDQLSKPYLANNSLIMGLSNVTYSVQNTTRTDSAGNPIRALFETPAGGAATEVVTGVEDMQIVYGVDTDADGEAEVYQDAATTAAAAQWAGVVSVRVSLLISTESEIGPGARPYTDLVGTAQAGDRHMRRTFTTTIGLRNRSF